MYNCTYKSRMSQKNSFSAIHALNYSQKYVPNS